MTKVVPFVHEVDLIKNGYGMRKIVLGLFRVVKGVLDPRDYCREEVHAEKRNQHEHGRDSPVVDSDTPEEGIVRRQPPKFVREIPQEVQSTHSIVAPGLRGVIESAILSMVEMDVNRPIEFRNVA